jgi:hypothetical protein
MRSKMVFSSHSVVIGAGLVIDTLICTVIISFVERLLDTKSYNSSLLFFTFASSDIAL